MKNLEIDINCDMGESFGQFKIGNDEGIFPHITSCSIACGFHGGDPLTIENTIIGALKNGVNVGAHPSYPDVPGFGRRKMDLQKAELKALIKYQIIAVKGLAECLGAAITYVKPHGALYNSMVINNEETKWVIEGIKEIDNQLMLMGLAGSQVESISKEMNIEFIAEAFADRRYEPDGTLMSRRKKNSIISDPNQAADQVISIIKNNSVESLDGTLVPIKARSICIHGDNPKAVEILTAITIKLAENNIIKKSFASR
ncbi:MAG TPA: 5-oxoprolinase subunit PxpA [Cyclobacteriaceae bacterium]